VAWPDEGEAAAAIGSGEIRSADSGNAVPVASLAKVMTALVLLKAHPLSEHDDAPTFLVTSWDVADTEARRAQDQSVIPVVAGEQLTERQALDAILLPSANNVAFLIPRTVAGSTAAFVGRMNVEARRLGMTATRYTAHISFRTHRRRDPRTLPVAGTVANTNRLVGRHGFVGVKTGTDSAAGDCLMFAVRFTRGGRTHLLLGVVLGQRNGPYIQAGLRAAQRLAAGTLATGR
jgi:D-alanyl-D-alanine carboxypeptidase (penicillin-binding protein 5/6)